jgi:uncharacterized protein YecE (DUF72 family)
MATTRIGISGWRYDPWRGTFYPKDLPQRAELEYASTHLPVIEINGSFYSLQRPESYASWYADTPADFMFTVKGPRYITHIRRLRDVATPVANFLASGLFNLKEKLGPILWQFAPNFKFDPERFEAFLELLPHDTREAAAVARKHDDWMAERVQLKVDAERPMRHAVEIRNESFLTTAFVDMLRKYDVALVIAETARKWPMTQDITADFVYMRLHGDKELYKSGYSDKSLDRWAKRISAWQKGSEPADAEKISPKKPPTTSQRDVFCFFDNTDVKLRAPFDAQTLMDKLGIPKRQVRTEFAKQSPGGASQQTDDAPLNEDALARSRPSGGKVRASATSTAKRRSTRKASGTGRNGDAVTTAQKRATGKARAAPTASASDARGSPRRGKAARVKAVKKRPAGTRAVGARTSGARQTVRPVRPRKSAASASRRRAATGSRRSSARS